MKKNLIVWRIAALLIIVGIGVISVLKFDFRQVFNNPFETNSYDIKESIQRIAVETITADITFIASDADTAYVTCHEQANLKHTVTVKDGTLSVTIHDTRKWYEHITLFNAEDTAITVSLPKGTYDTLTIDATTGDTVIPNDLSFRTLSVEMTTGDVTCKASVTDAMTLHLTTGDIALADACVGSADLSVTTGDVTATQVSCDGELSVKIETGETELTDVTCQSLTSIGTTGDLHLKNVVASGSFDIKRTTGDVCFDRADAADLTVNVTTGDVTGTLLNDKIFLTKSTTGRINVPKTTTGGTCDVTSTTGDITIDIVK